MAKFLLSTAGILMALLTFGIVVTSLNMQVKGVPHGMSQELRFNETGRILTADVIAVFEKNPLVKSDSIITCFEFDGGSLTLNNNPKLLIWTILFALMAGMSWLLIFGQLREIEPILPRLRYGWIIFIVCAGIAFISSGMLAYSSFEHNDIYKFIAPFDVIRYLEILFYKPVFTTIFFGQWIGFMAGGLAFFGLLITNASVSNERENTMTLETFNFYNDRLTFFLSSCSILIVFSVVLLSFIHQALATAIKVRDVNLFSTDFIYAYGFVFSIVLAIIYAPVYQNLRSVSKNIPELRNQESKSFFGTFQSLLSIIAPLLTSSISELIKNL